MDEQDQRTERILRIAEDALRDSIVAAVPQIKTEVELMAKMIREMVDTERAKSGLDDPRGQIGLVKNQDKEKHDDPDMIGSGRVSGRTYQAAGWFEGKEELKIHLLPNKGRHVRPIR